MTEITSANELAVLQKAKKILDTMLEECLNEMISAGIPVQKDKIITIGLASFNKTHALCSFREIGNETYFIIAIRKDMLYYLEDDVVMANVKNSVYHELIHTCPDCRSHNDEFMKWSSICDKKLGTKTRMYMEDAFYYNKKPVESGITYVCRECGNIYISDGVFANDITCELCEEVMTRKNDR